MIVELALAGHSTILVCEQPRAFAWRSHVKDFAVTLDNIPLVADLWLDK